MPKINKECLEEIFNNLHSDYHGNSEYETVLKDVHFGVALIEAGREMTGLVDIRAEKLIKNSAKSI
tara:strand:+ start:227 stop:424 length:198 start_codon:yes stop_codon:yes gene_type:complete